MADAPPKAVKVTPPPEQEKKPSGRPRGRPPKLETELEDMFTELGALLMMVDTFDGMVVIHQAGANAEALGRLAQKNARVKKALERLAAISNMSAVLGAVGGTAIPILIHHKVLPPVVPFSDDWLEPPERKAFMEQLKQQMGGGNGEQPT